MSKPKAIVQPLNSNILGLPEKTSLRTKTGIFLPKSTEKLTSITSVIGIGALVSSVKVGDKIIYKDYSQHEFNYNGVDYVLIDEQDVLANILKEGEV